MILIAAALEDALHDRRHCHINSSKILNGNRKKGEEEMTTRNTTHPHPPLYYSSNPKSVFDRALTGGRPMKKKFDSNSNN